MPPFSRNSEKGVPAAGVGGAVQQSAVDGVHLVAEVLGAALERQHDLGAGAAVVQEIAPARQSRGVGVAVHQVTVQLGHEPCVQGEQGRIDRRVAENGAAQEW